MNKLSKHSFLSYEETIAMTYLSDLNGTSCSVLIHSVQDLTFKKKPVRSTELFFRLHTPPSPFLKHINYFGNGFKICLTDPMDDNAAQIEFERKINELNTVLGHLAEEALITFVVAQCTNMLNDIANNLRDENGKLKGSYEVKSIFSDALVMHLRTYDIEARCNIGRGTLYLGDDVLVNSGITQQTTLSSGIIDFLGFRTSQPAEYQYMLEYSKAPTGSYEAGSWSNKLGDKPLALSFSIMVLDALERFVTTTVKLAGLSIDDNSFLSTSLRSAIEQKKAMQQEYDSMIQVTEFETTQLLSNKAVQTNESYQELLSLGLGEAATQCFAKDEAPKILLQELANSIGASKAFIFNAQERSEEWSKHGMDDEFYLPHVTLPHQKTRKGMLAFKKALTDTNSWASVFFDPNKLKLNVASTADYDQHFEEITNQREMLDVCLGARYPLVKPGDVVRFIFKL